MPDFSLICRICLSVNLKMFTLKNTNMENLYTLLTQAYIDAEDGKPTNVCFLCYARLRQCDRLQQQAVKSNELLEQLLRGGIMQAETILNHQYSSQDLQVSCTYYLNLEPANCQGDSLHPKVETGSHISVREEVEGAIDKGQNVTDLPEEANDSYHFDHEARHSDPEDNQLIKEICSNKSVEEEENLCLIQQNGAVKNDHHQSHSTQIQQKDKTSDNHEKAEEIYMKTDRKLRKRKINVESNEQKAIKPCQDDTQKKCVDCPKTPIINTIIDKFECNECGKQFSTKDILTDHIIRCMNTTENILSDFPKRANNSYDFDPKAKHSDPRDNQLIKAICPNKSVKVKDIAHKTKRRKLQKENLCLKQQNRKIQQKDKPCKNHEKAKGIYMKSDRKLRKRKINVKLNEQNIQKPRYNDATQKKYVKLRKKPMINTSIDKFKCNECDKQFSTKNILNSHFIQCMKTKENILSGKQLTKANNSKPLLLEMYSCDICTFETNLKRSIETHLKMHKVTNVLSCKICAYRCAYESDLKRHMKKHTDEKPFSCNYCEYRCAHKFTLTTHTRYHTGEKPYSCNICDYRCVQKGSLKTHMRNHTGEKPFCCNFCDYRCAQKGSLNRHMGTHRLKTFFL